MQIFGMDPYMNALMNNAGMITSDLPIRTGRSYSYRRILNVAGFVFNNYL